MDTSSEFLFGHDAKTLSAGLPYPFYATSGTAVTEHASTNFAAALSEAQLVSSQRSPFGATWPLLEFWHDRIREPMSIIRQFLDPILAEAVAKRRSSGTQGLVNVKG
ncbi:hypothetical protein C8J57DRAFT_1710566 [Mycena rebaudengoi]|nr:hypothetical protein C8J57DRAFT_1710566 [Mycena rebaudengoi]